MGLKIWEELMAGILSEWHGILLGTALL